MSPDESRKRDAARPRESAGGFAWIRWFESLRADSSFGWRQLAKRKVASAAAILSLGLAIGACTSVFRLADALLLRPLPVAQPEQLHLLSKHGLVLEGKPTVFDAWAYPAFRQMREAAEDQAELLAISYARRTDLTYKSDLEMEKAWLQYVSGWTFDALGLQPALGRLLVADDDREPGAHPYAVISHDYWARRFGGDPDVIGRSFRIGNQNFEIIGVVNRPFTGTEPGIATDVFVPTMMHPRVMRPDSQWFRTFACIPRGVALEPLRARLDAISRTFEEERLKGVSGVPREMIDRLINLRVALEPAAAGVSGLQGDYRRPLVALGGLAALVLLIACANVANLKTAQAAGRSREMALRISLGAGRWRLAQLVLVESAWLGLLAAGIGVLFSVWAAPFLVSSINPADDPAHLNLPMDWRVFGFGAVLTIVAMLLFGLLPAMRVSALKPAHALKGGSEPHPRHPLMHALIAVQIAFCFVVLFATSLFVATFDRLSNRPTGFDADGLLVLDTVAQSPQSPATWEQATERLQAIPGVDAVALAGWPLMTGESWNDFPSINNAPPGSELAWFLNVSPGWTETMGIPVLDGRSLRAGDDAHGTALVNQTFAHHFFEGGNPIGQSFANGRGRYEIVGVVRDVVYGSLRGPIPPQAYVPFALSEADGAPRPVRDSTFLVRTSGRDPRVLAPTLRRAIAEAGPGFRVSNIRTQTEINQAQTVRERLLARLASFFGVVALLLAGVGVYGVFDYTVQQRRREIGIRMALGAQRRTVLGSVVGHGMRLAGVGIVAGLIAALALTRVLTAVLTSLLFETGPEDPTAYAGAILVIASVVLLACWLPAKKATRIDPMETLRAE